MLDIYYQMLTIVYCQTVMRLLFLTATNFRLSSLVPLTVWQNKRDGSRDFVWGVAMYNTSQRNDAKKFLQSSVKQMVSEDEIDTSVRRVYEIDTPNGTEVWIEWESKLEEPEYRYSLMHYTGVSE